MAGEWVINRETRGAIGVLEETETTDECLRPSDYDGTYTYPGDSRDDYYNYCAYLTCEQCYVDFCSSDFARNCADECDLARSKGYGDTCARRDTVNRDYETDPDE